jgi:hypothetical protein
MDMTATGSPLSSSASWSPTSSTSGGARQRRKREAIELPSDLDLADMDPKEVKKIKNRIAAARLRERSQRQIRDLEAQVALFRARTEMLERIVAQCPHCSACVAQMDAANAVKVESPDCLAMGVEQGDNQLPLHVEALELTDTDCAVLQELLDIW